jgi:hypothetical protein
MDPTTITLTTSTLLKLNQQINNVAGQSNLNSTYFGYTLAISTGILTTLVILFQGVQWFYTRHDQKKEFSKLTEDIKADLGVSLKELTDTSEKEFRKEFKEISNSLRADISRFFGLQSENAKFYRPAFTWFLGGAYLYNQGHSDNLAATCLRAAMRNLNKMELDDFKSIEFKNKLADIQNQLSALKEKYSIDVRLIQDVIESKSKQAMNPISKF